MLLCSLPPYVRQPLASSCLVRLGAPLSHSVVGCCVVAVYSSRSTIQRVRVGVVTHVCPSRCARQPHSFFFPQTTPCYHTQFESIPSTCPPSAAFNRRTFAPTNGAVCQVALCNVNGVFTSLCSPFTCSCQESYCSCTHCPFYAPSCSSAIANKKPGACCGGKFLASTHTWLNDSFLIAASFFISPLCEQATHVAIAAAPPAPTALALVATATAIQALATAIVAAACRKSTVMYVCSWWGMLHKDYHELPSHPTLCACFHR